jgi:hypothetical protein
MVIDAIIDKQAQLYKLAAAQHAEWARYPFEQKRPVIGGLKEVRPSLVIAITLAPTLTNTSYPNNIQAI